MLHDSVADANLGDVGVLVRFELVGGSGRRGAKVGERVTPFGWWDDLENTVLHSPAVDGLTECVEVLKLVHGGLKYRNAIVRGRGGSIGRIEVGGLDRGERMLVWWCVRQLLRWWSR